MQHHQRSGAAVVLVMTCTWRWISTETERAGTTSATRAAGPLAERPWRPVARSPRRGHPARTSTRSSKTVMGSTSQTTAECGVPASRHYTM